MHKKALSTSEILVKYSQQHLLMFGKALTVTFGREELIYKI